MKERPILFSAPMVRAILEGRKTQTRRVVKPQPTVTEDLLRQRGAWIDGESLSDQVNAAWQHGFVDVACPYGQPGDRLWVRETFKDVASGSIRNGSGEIRYGVVYKADAAVIWKPRPTIIHDLRGFDTGPMQFEQRPWHSSIHMPRSASRITLEITDVRVSRLQDISEDDAISEGIRELPLQEGEPGAWWCVDPLGNPSHHYRTPRCAFSVLWDSINAKRRFNWNANPWVWALTFERMEQPA